MSFTFPLHSAKFIHFACGPHFERKTQQEFIHSVQWFSRSKFDITFLNKLGNMNVLKTSLLLKKSKQKRKYEDSRWRHLLVVVVVNFALRCLIHVSRQIKFLIYLMPIFYNLMIRHLLNKNCMTKKWIFIWNSVLTCDVI